MVVSVVTGHALYRTAPFLVFISFIGIEQALRFFGKEGVVGIPSEFFTYLYPVKALSVGALLLLFLPHYHEVRLRDLKSVQTIISIVVGAVVFVLWINMDWPFATLGTPQGFKPPDGTGALADFLLLTRLAGAVVVVPVMEELFWRSFLLRYLIDHQFENVPLGRFTWISFSFTTILFGFEHHFFLAGIVAGAVYNMILYYTKSISQCIVAHTVTNLALGMYVLHTGKWYFW